MKNKLTTKQKGFITEYLRNGGNATQAALRAYNANYTTAKAIGCENLAKPYVKNELERLMCYSGLVEDAVETVRAGLHAENSGGSPHWPSRLKACDMVFKLAGTYERRESDEDLREEPEVVIDFSKVHPEVTRYYAIRGEWPEPEIERRLLDGELMEQVEEQH